MEPEIEMKCGCETSRVYRIGSTVYKEYYDSIFQVVSDYQLHSRISISEKLNFIPTIIRVSDRVVSMPYIQGRHALPYEEDYLDNEFNYLCRKKKVAPELLDIHGENIIIDEKGQCFLIDFDSY